MTYELSEAGFRDEAGELRRSIRTELISGGAELEKQHHSLEEYVETHERGGHSAEIKTLMGQFERFLALQCLVNAPRSAKPLVLDVGCGISRQVPPYMRTLQSAVTYVGLDPFEKNPERDYLFINGTFQGLRRHVRTRFDCLIFSTSLDHFPDLAQVSEEIRATLAPGGLAVFWVGLHDPAPVARQALAEWIATLDVLDPLQALAAVARFPRRVYRLRRAMRARRSKLERSARLDELHFHYFTQASLNRYLGGLGEVVSRFEAPLTNSVFYAVRLAGGLDRAS